mmetsp:Transcript_28464/g.82009  ORF Transcript_28464/g.82009 Transcript_28464/m.82009 type:complete len:134 (+) Transcript_28464:288-689(+)
MNYRPSMGQTFFLGRPSYQPCYPAPVLCAPLSLPPSPHPTPSHLTCLSVCPHPRADKHARKMAHVHRQAGRQAGMATRMCVYVCMNQCSCWVVGWIACVGVMSCRLDGSITAQQGRQARPTRNGKKDEKEGEK